VPAMVTFCGLPPSRCCHWDAPGASGPLVFTQFHSFGHGLNTCVVARTTRATAANTVKPFHPGPLPEATLDTLTRSSGLPAHAEKSVSVGYVADAADRTNGSTR
jgi:hypothetical protein